MTSTPQVILLLDRDALEGSMQSHLEGQGQTCNHCFSCMWGAQSSPGLEESGRALLKRKPGLLCAQEGGAESACAAVSTVGQGSSPRGSRGRRVRGGKAGPPLPAWIGACAGVAEGPSAGWARGEGRLHAPPNTHCRVRPTNVVAPGSLAQPLDWLLFCPDLGSWDRDWLTEGNL